VGFGWDSDTGRLIHLVVGGRGVLLNETVHDLESYK
jgi:hypothetical protein